MMVTKGYWYAWWCLTSGIVDASLVWLVWLGLFLSCCGVGVGRSGRVGLDGVLMPCVGGGGVSTLLGPEESAVRAARESGRVVGASGPPSSSFPSCAGGVGVGGVVV